VGCLNGIAPPARIVARTSKEVRATFLGGDDVEEDGAGPADGG
jgi:hypothetical protein